MSDPIGVGLIACAIYYGLRSIADAIRSRSGNRTVIVRHEFREGDDGPR
ncbi:hypothetical protein NMQ14_13015 [Methyloversatilis sp. XJ19-13]|nr:hypothetical protein [Methyloversatilis sp. XJ19-13]MCQ9375173.1 hypothetical protein [Methyloversatilis sp. XJ19-13]